MKSLKILFSSFSFILLLISGCTNITQSLNSLTTTVNPSILSGGSTSAYTHELSNVAVIAAATPSGSTTAQIELSLSVDTSSTSFKPLTNYCGLTPANACFCHLEWTEVNTVGGQTNTYARTKRLSATAVQSGLAKCKIDETVWGEIPSGTQIRMNIVAATANGSGLNVKSLVYKTGTSVASNGDFLDNTLTPFRNIFHYSCFSKVKSTYELANQYTPVTYTDSATNVTTTYNVMIGSQMCSGASTGGSNQCGTLRSGFSAQNYYRNFYIRSDKLGQINSTNNTYDCPKVVESIKVSAAPAVPAEEKGKYWPLDTSFALATTYSSEWNVGVRSASILYKNGDANSVNTGCVNENVTKRLSEAGIVTQCLGYGKKPNNNGTCGTIQDNNGRVRPLVRLRRYRVIYPAMFQANGESVKTNLYADEVYVADRLVLQPNGVSSGDMIYGPKPCNFAWFDHEGVVNREGADEFNSGLGGFNGTVPDTAPRNVYATPGYVATSRYYRNSQSVPAWLPEYSVNPDGVVFPNYDYGSSQGAAIGPSCSATLPVVNSVLGSPSFVKLVTSHISRSDFLSLGSRRFYLNEIHVQPVDPWSPDYLEDTSFKACVPVADPYLEPPMHFYNNGSTMSWCTISYPTQNPYWVDLNVKRKPDVFSTSPTANVVNWQNGTGSARVLGYTSHNNTGAGLLDSLNSCSGTNESEICTMTGSLAGCTTFLAKGGVQTCDRTVTYDANQEYRGFPLQAHGADIESMLAADQAKDKTYTCQYSVSTDATKVNARTPSSGCCGVVNGTPLLQPLIGGAGLGGHLEPYRNPVFPTMRFCGSPVQ